MTVQAKSTVESNLQKVWEELEAARKMQDDWMDRGVDFVDLYVEDAGGDWLEKWEKCEKELELIKNKKVDVAAVKAAIDLEEFGRTELLEIALTGPWQAGDRATGQNVKHQRLSLLGGAIFGAVVTDYLYRTYPDLNCDCISTLKSRFTDHKKVAELAQKLKLSELSRPAGRGNETDKSEDNNFLSQTFEALFGAIYLEFDRNFCRAGKWLIERSLEPTLSQHIDLTQQPESAPENELKRREILGAAILEAIAIDYLYNRFPERNASQLISWKNLLVAKQIFPKDFQAKLGSRYLELESNFSRTSDWLVDNFIKTAIDELIEETDSQPEYLIDTGNPESLPEFVSKIADKKWKNEFLRTVGILQPADELLLLMQDNIDSMVAKNESLQQLLIWANNKSLSAEKNFKGAEIRAFYVALVCVLAWSLTRVLDPSLEFDKSQVCQLRKCLEKAEKDVEFADVSGTGKHDFYGDLTGVLVGILALDLEPELKQLLQQFQRQMPEVQNWKKWRKECGKIWLEKFKMAIG
ncbi:MAG: ribonuclease III domain-containing protein, partial [Microcoleus sp.]|uniref:ribonuclease III domain-containing protein n=1 Tax=Microcoleus sp. TaxID=44472 RepID=UPI003C75F3A8